MRWRISKNILVSYERFFLFSLRFFVGFLSFEYCLHCFISAWAIITTLTNFYVRLSNFWLIFQISCQLVASAKTKSLFKMLFTRFFAHTFCIRRFLFLTKKIGADYIEWCNFTLCKNHLAKWKQRKSLIWFYNWNLLKWVN